MAALPLTATPAGLLSERPGCLPGSAVEPSSGLVWEEWEITGVGGGGEAVVRVKASNKTRGSGEQAEYTMGRVYVASRSCLDTQAAEAFKSINMNRVDTYPGRVKERKYNRWGAGGSQCLAQCTFGPRV